MKKNILLVDDSALMRRVLCDIINQDSRFHVADKAVNGKDALALLMKNEYDAVVLDVNMPIMNGLQLLKELQKRKIAARVMMASTDTKEGAKTTLDALELGALDFVHKPDNAFDCKENDFKETLLRTLAVVAESKPVIAEKAYGIEEIKATKKFVEIVRRHATSVAGNKVVAIASSTGGPRALQSVIPKLPKELNAPVVLVQHMPAGFTKSLSERLDSLSEVSVKEAEEGDVLENGHVYIARGGAHLNVVTERGQCKIHYTDEPTREGVKPCANYMYESLCNSPYSEIVCVVMTGMGQDGTVGITNLNAKKKIHVIAQQEDTCAVYGMPRAIVKSGLSNQIVELPNIAQEIIMNVGVK